MNAWDQRYDIDTFYYGTAPNDFLRARVGDLPPGGRVLCIGEGEGRNAVFLAKQGFAVTAVDMSHVGLDKLQQRQEGRTKEWRAQRVPMLRKRTRACARVHVLAAQRTSWETAPKICEMTAPGRSLSMRAACASSTAS